MLKLLDEQLRKGVVTYSTGIEFFEARLSLWGLIFVITGNHAHPLAHDASMMSI